MIVDVLVRWTARVVGGLLLGFAVYYLYTFGVSSAPPEAAAGALLAVPAGLILLFSP